MISYLSTDDLKKIIDENEKLDIDHNPYHYALRNTFVRESAQQLAKRWQPLINDLLTVVAKARVLNKVVEEVKEDFSKKEYTEETYRYLSDKYWKDFYTLIDQYLDKKFLGIDISFVQDCITHLCSSNPVQAGKLLAKSIFITRKEWGIAKLLLDHHADVNQETVTHQATGA